MNKLLPFIAPVLFLFGGCSFDSYAPSDTAIADAVRVVETTSPDSPEYAVAVAKLEAMRSQRAAADATVDVAANGLNVLLPGLGGLLAVGYGAMQRARASKDKSALTATMIAIDEFKKNNGGEAAAVLMQELATNHDRAGVRTAIRKALAELKAQDVQPGK